MNTFLGACVNLDVQDLDENLIKNSKIVYLEGYLFDPPKAKEAFIKAAEIAKNEQNLVSMTLSDSFCVERHRSDFISFIQNYVDILFCNEVHLIELIVARPASPSISGKSAKSAPVQKDFSPEPIRIATMAESSALNSCHANGSSFDIRLFTAFS